MTRITPWVSIVICVCLITVTSCSKSVRLSPPYTQLGETSDGGTYRVETVDGRKYETNQLTRTDSTLVIPTLGMVLANRSSDLSRRDRVEPFEIGFSDVVLVETKEFSLVRTVGCVVLVGAFFYGAAVGIYFLANPPGAWD